MIQLARIYGTQIRLGFQAQVQYRVATGFALLGLIIEPIVYLVVWKTIAEAQGTVSSLAGRVTVVALIPGTDPGHGWLLLPSEVVHWLAMRSPLPSQRGTVVGPEEAAWLRYLADGQTVAALADGVGFVTGDGTVTIALTTPSKTALSLGSRESANPPELVVVVN